MAITVHFFLQNKVCDTIKLREKIIAFCVDLYALKEFYVFSSDVKCSGSLSHSHFEYNNMISHNKKKTNNKHDFCNLEPTDRASLRKVLHFQLTKLVSSSVL